MLKNTKIKKNNLIKLGELSLAGAVLASLNVNTTPQKHVKASGNKIENDSTKNTQTLDTSALSHMMNKNTKNTSSVQSLSENKVSAGENTSNGGFDSSWGTLNAKDWQGHVVGDYYVLDNYSGDPYHVIVPNQSDLQAAGIDTQGKQVGVSSGLMHQIYEKLYQHNDGASIAFSKTNNNKVKAIGENWEQTFSANGLRGYLTQFDGSNLDVSSVTNMRYLFSDDELSDVSSLANWDTSNVTDMSYMFHNNQLKDTTPFLKWNTSKVTDMEQMLDGNKISNLAGLKNWDVSNVTSMRGMLSVNHISDLTPLQKWNISNVKDMSGMLNMNLIQKLNGLEDWQTDNVTNMGAIFNADKIDDLTPIKNWDVSNVTNMSTMFGTNEIDDLTPIKNWNTSKVNDMSWMFNGNRINDLNPISNWDVSKVTNMDGMFEIDNLNNLNPLQNWNVSNVTDMDAMFANNNILFATPLKNWNTSNVTDMNKMFTHNPLQEADFSKWDFSKISDRKGTTSKETGLYHFIDPTKQYATIYLGNNNTFPSWFMQTSVNGKSNNNVFNVNYGGNLILTSNQQLLSNPNNDFNHISANVNGNNQVIETPVFVNSNFDNILQDANKIQHDAVSKLKSQNPNYNFDNPDHMAMYDTTGKLESTQYDASNPIHVVNAAYNAQRQYSITINFADSTSCKDLDSNSVTLNEPENGGTIDYDKANDTITKLQQDGYDVSNINANKPSSLISAWNDADKLQNVTTDAYKISNNDGKITITYNISHRHVNVTHDNPKTTNDIIDGTNKHYPTGVDQSDLNETIKMPVTYYNEDKPFSQKEIIKQETDSFSQTRNATIDVVTGNVDYTEWQGGRVITATAPHGFMIDDKSYWLPEIPGYTFILRDGPRFVKGLTVNVPNEDLLKEIERLVGKSGMPVPCTGIDTPASIAVTDNHGNNLDKYATQTHGHYGSVITWNDASTPDKINSIVKQMQDDGYSVDTSKLNSEQFKDTKYSDDTKAKPLTTIVGTERLVKVTHDQPKTTNDTIDGTTKKYPAGVGQDDLNRTITRTITLTDENGKPMGKTITQTVHMHRDATVNAVTGAIKYTDWTADGSFDSVDVPKIDGYTPDKNAIPKVDNPEIGKDYNTSVVYTRNNEDASITYIDDTTGQVLKSESIKPKFGDTIKFATEPSDYIKQLEAKGYDLVSNDYKDGATASTDVNQNKFTVHVKHHLNKVERAKDVHEHISYNVTDSNGKTSSESSKNDPVLHFTQSGVKDAVTGKTDWNGKLNSQTFSSVDTAKKPGYVADISTIPSKTVTLTNDNWNKNHDINTTVNYKPAEESVKLVIKDENGKVIATIIKTGKYGDSYDFTGNKAPKIDGYTFEKASDNAKGKFDVNNKDIVLTYKKNETKKPEKPVTPTKPSKSQRTPEDTSIFGQNIAAQKDNQGLPEMAENKSGLIAAGVGIASLVGLTGLAGVQLKKREKHEN